MYRIGDSIKTESKIVVARDEGRGKMGNDYKCIEDFSWDNECSGIRQ